jgi:hypothetical protein
MHVLMVAALGLGLPMAAADIPNCPQERAVYSLAGSTLSFFPKDTPPGWTAVLKWPNGETVALDGATSHGFDIEKGPVIRAYLIWPGAWRGRDWSEVSLNESLPGAPNPAARAFTAPNIPPVGTWRLTGCAAP